MFDRHTYNKGALVLHMVRYLLGEEGWWKGIRAYVERFAGQTVTTADLQDAMEDGHRRLPRRRSSSSTSTAPATPS